MAHLSQAKEKLKLAHALKIYIWVFGKEDLGGGCAGWMEKAETPRGKQGDERIA